MDELTSIQHDWISSEWETLVAIKQVQPFIYTMFKYVATATGRAVHGRGFLAFSVPKVVKGREDGLSDEAGIVFFQWFHTDSFGSKRHQCLSCYL